MTSFGEYARRCSECGRTLVGRSVLTKTCTDACRAKRSRRLQRENKEIANAEAGGSAFTPAQAQMAAIVNGKIKEIAHEVLKEELRPVARDALTEDVLRSIDQLVALTPEAIAAIAADIRGDDPVLRQRAYTLVTKYTLGHPALVRPADTDPSAQLVVNIGLPRPTDSEQADAETDAEETVTCDMCAAEKPASEFVAGSQRCRTCWEEQRAQVEARFGTV